MKNLKNKGISLITLVITIVVMLILAAVAIGGSTRLIDDSVDSKKQASINDDNDEVRSLLTHAITNSSLREGVSLIDGSLVVIGSGDKEYGTGYYLLPGGEDDVMKVITDKVGNPNLKKYKGLTAPYVVDYDNGTYERIEEVRFK